jgi:hypothetical protein
LSALTEWAAQAATLLEGRTITGVRYMTPDEASDLSWRSASIVLELSAKGDQPAIVVWPSADDEGNNAGALFTTDKDLETIPVI